MKEFTGLFSLVKKAGIWVLITYFLDFCSWKCHRLNVIVQIIDRDKRKRRFQGKVESKEVDASTIEVQSLKEKFDIWSRFAKISICVAIQKSSRPGYENCQVSHLQSIPVSCGSNFSNNREESKSFYGLDLLRLENQIDVGKFNNATEKAREKSDIWNWPKVNSVGLNGYLYSR